MYEKELFEIRDKCRSNLNKYLNSLLEKIPQSNEYTLLDIGCGSGVSSIEIAKKYGYKITAMDIDESALSVFREKAVNLEIDIINGTFNTAISEGMNFDIVLAEGLFNVIGFTKGLKEAYIVLKKGGYLIIHDEQKEMSKKSLLINNYGFKILETLELDENIWGKIYCECLRNELMCIDFEGLTYEEIEEFKIIKSLLELYETSPKSFNSVYYLLQKDS